MLPLLPIATSLAQDAVARQARSALPDAPVLPDPPPRRPVRIAQGRAALARALERAAHAVAPAPAPHP